MPLACVIIPRVGKADAPDARAEPVARLRGIAAHHAIPLFDLSDTFDHHDPAQLEIAAWDDHPNALGHRAALPGLARARERPDPECTLFHSESTTLGPTEPRREFRGS